MTKSNRSNVGIEALRVLAMLMIVSLHYLGHGGVIHSPDSTNYYLGWMLESLSYVAVNCYVLISGYLLINSTKFRFKRVFDIWLQVFFYSVGIFLIFIYTQDTPISLAPFMPIKFKIYWFATAYLGLYLFHPYINQVLKLIDRKSFNRLIVIIVILLSVMSFSGIDTFQVEGGYSLIWMIALYIVGAYIRLRDFKSDSLAMFGIYFVLSLLTYLMKLNFDGDINLDVLYAYNSITVLGASVALFMCFKDLKLDVPVVSHFFRFLGPLTFGVYLIHENPYIREVLWKYLDVTAYYNSTDFFKNYVISVLSVFIVCALIEKVRQVVFNIPIIIGVGICKMINYVKLGGDKYATNNDN